MAKTFLEVFPELHVTEELHELLKLVAVERIAATRDRSSIRIYMTSPRLMHKQNIYGLEKGIKDQLFPNKRVSIKIVEKFRLSDQYTPQKLLQVYKASILLELKNYSIIEYSIFRKADITFPEDGILEMTIVDNLISKEKAGDLKRILEKIFQERCGLPVEIRYLYIKQETPLPEIPDPFPVPIAPSISEPSVPVEPKQKEHKREFKRDSKSYGYQRRSDNPDVLYGRDFEDEFIDIRQIAGEMGEVTVKGKIINTDSRLLGSGKTIVIFDLTDFTDTITVKIFAKEEALEDINLAVVKGQFIKLKGMTTIDKFDGELTIGSVFGMKRCEDFSGKRTDHSPVKRVELHCHTKMSDMDGVSEVTDIVKRASKWGMPAIAITDHGCVQSFPDANHALDRDDPLKVIYGVEGYLVDDLKQLVDHPRNQSFEDTYVVFDIETTGFSP
ncbi:MAG: PHP domain-containing protein, partial [Hungatella sp.]